MSWLREALRGVLSEEKLRLVPRGFQQIGRIAILSLPNGLTNEAEIIAKKILETGQVDTVALKTGGIEGWRRKPTIKIIAGKPQTETIHKEAGCIFKLDVAETMFSKGNLSERQRIADLVKEGEVVADLFAGVGQFSIPIAKRGRAKLVYAIEKNPIAFKYLCENVRLNKVGHIVMPILGDCALVAPRGIADRVILGILHVGHVYLPLASEVLKEDGGVIHYHETVPVKMAFERPLQRITKGVGREIKKVEVRIVKKYSPKVLHVVVDADVGRRTST
ncbi:MAG: class I SAM-dependent methyltransferase family protein [Candidatus Hadarchaeales archaeon]